MMSTEQTSATAHVDAVVMPCCDTCRFWKLDEDDGTNERIGICKRFPPVSVLTENADIEYDQARPFEGRAAHSFIFWAQPRVLETDGCGEHRTA